MGVTSENLQRLGIVDETIPEPLGGAHRDIETIYTTLKTHLIKQLQQLQEIPIDRLLEQRYQRVMSYGNS